MATYAIVRPSDNMIVGRVVWDGSASCDFEAVYGAGVSAVLYTSDAYVGGWYEDGVGFHAPMPKITGIAPATGGTGGGTTVTLSGLNLNTPGVVVKFDGTEATNIQNQTDTSLDCDTPAHAVGQVDVTVENDAGSWTGQSTLTDGFEYTS